MADVTAALWRTTRDSFFLAVNVSAWLFVIIWFCCYLLMLCGKVTFGQQALIVSKLKVEHFEEQKQNLVPIKKTERFENHFICSILFRKQTPSQMFTFN